ncbi:hypothetical protein IFU39_19090 [Paenibacillus sp. CFBP 13594]|uniref:hypothetical protein n=1 Tax=Paenibacillus sp. CFBP 13594 TaxID=2774037 RepID=UPI0017855C3E|nr:hypothetical protein [Paenibacillus sp. CFBP 13594]MBD8839923.1 hypothetical protein [Paenibacillus sp. CFBP 13594]
MKVKLLLKDGRGMVSRTNDYAKEHIEAMLVSIESDFDIYVEGNYVCKGNEVKALVAEF